MRTSDQRRLNAVQRPDAYEEVVIASGGVPVVLSVWRGSPSAPAVLFLPGTMTHPLFYEDFLDALNREGMTVVGLHPQAHGKSPRVRKPLTLAALLQNGRDALQWMRARFPDTSAVVFGSSQGSMLAMLLAAERQPMSAVFAHNVHDPALPSSIGVTRFPTSWSKGNDPMRRTMRALAAVAPRLPVPFASYLQMDRVTRDPEIVELLDSDPLGRRSYPMEFMAGLVNVDTSGMRDGSIACPVVVITASGDRLFTLDYTRQVFETIVAPHKELVVIDSDTHLIFNEALEEVLLRLVPLLRDRSGATADRD